MYLFVLLLAMGILVHDQYVPDPVATPALIQSSWQLLGVILLPKLLLVILYGLACRRTYFRLGSAMAAKALRRLDRATLAMRIAALLLYGMDLWLGALRWIRMHTWNLLLVDDLLMLAPTLLVIAAGWWLYYPIDRRLRDATLLARLDAGLPIHPVWTRWQYLLAQFRHQVAMLLVPLLLLTTWDAVVQRYIPDTIQVQGIALDSILAAGGSLGILLISPLLIRYIWDTAPLPAGAMRDDLTALCHHHRIRVHDLLLWRTYGGMVNGAVLGFVAPLRYILLTDALLELMPARQVEAVMAHEIAHIRKHHMVWLVLAIVATVGLALPLLTMAISVAIPLIARIPVPWHLSASAWAVLSDPRTHEAAGMVLALAICGPIFCYISRRFERQADTFAVQHLTRRLAEDLGAPAPALVEADSAATMGEALQAVADLNHIPIHRHSWRHGSIAWRQDYLHHLPGRPMDRLPIDRIVARIKIATIVAIAISLVLWFQFG